MKLSSAIFYFSAGKDGIHFVSFVENGIVVKLCGSEPKTLPNPLKKWGGREYKPCETHARELLTRALRKPLKTTGARKRANASKSVRPKLFKA